MADFRQLEKILEKELRYQELILEVLAKERSAIVRLNHEQIVAFAADKERLIEQAMALEEERRSIIAILCKNDFDKEIKKVMLRDLLAHCPDRQAKRRLESVAEELKAAASAVKELNEHNGSLIKHSLGLIASTMAIMQSQPDADLPTYSRGGKLTSTREDPAFASRRALMTRAA